MTNVSLAKSYLIKAQKRLRVLPALLAEDAYSDVIREAQEIVELALKGMLRHVGVEPPRWHDVGTLLQEYRLRFPPEVAGHVDNLARISAWLRKELEFSFYGDIDFIPTERYARQDAERALADARVAVSAAESLIVL